MKSFKNILVVRTDRMGDVVLTIPAVRALKAAFPDAKVSVWLDASTQSLMQGLSFVDEVVVESKSLKGWGFLSFVAFLRQKKFDLAVIYHSKRHTNTACWLAGIPCRLGYLSNKNGWMLTHPVLDRRNLGEKHESLFCLDLLQEIGVYSSDVSLQLPHDGLSDAWAKAWVKDELKGAPFLVIHPDASCATRCWPAKSFAKLIDLIKNIGMKIVLVGGKGARVCAAEIISQTGAPLVDMTGKTTLPQLVSLFRLAQAVVSNDSGPVHLAAGVGTPVVSIFLRRQPGINPERWHPLGDKAKTVLPEKGKEIVIDAQSRVLSGSFDAITPDQVVNALMQALKKDE